MFINKKSRLQLRLNNIVFLLLFLSCVSLLAWISHQYSWRSDWTVNQRNSLNKDSILLLKTLEKPVTIRSYQPADSSNTDAATEILNNYQRIKTNFNFKILNPDLEINLAKSDHIERYGQTLVIYNNKQEIIDNLSEQSISNALLRLSRKTSAQISFITNHGERDPNSDDNTGYSQLAQQLHNKGFQINSLNLLVDDIVKETKVIVIAGSENKWLAGEFNKIVQYVNQGGNLLWLRDPGESHLSKLTEILGIDFLNGVVVDNDTKLRKTLGIQHPAVVPIIQYGEHKITKDMRYNTLFPISNAIKSKVDSDWQTTNLLITLDSSWSDTDGFSLEVNYDEAKGDIKGPLILGMALHRDSNDKNQRVVVIGDSDFLANTYIGTGANLLLAMNTMNWLSEDDQLIAIQVKNAPDLKLQLSDTQIFIISFGFLIIMPIILLVSGIIIWQKRRKQ